MKRILLIITIYLISIGSSVNASMFDINFSFVDTLDNVVTFYHYKKDISKNQEKYIYNYYTDKNKQKEIVALGLYKYIDDNGINYMKSEKLEKIANFNMKILKKLGTKMNPKKTDYQTRVKIMTSFKKKVEKVNKLIEDRLNKFNNELGWGRGKNADELEKKIKKYMFYQDVLIPLNTSLQFMVDYVKANKYDPYWKEKLKRQEIKRQKQENLKRNNPDRILKEIEDKYNCYNYQYAKNVNVLNYKKRYNKQFFEKMIGLSACIMKKGGITDSFYKKMLNIKYNISIQNKYTSIDGKTVVAYAHGFNSDRIIQLDINSIDLYYDLYSNNSEIYNVINTIIHENTHYINYLYYKQYNGKKGFLKPFIEFYNLGWNYNYNKYNNLQYLSITDIRFLYKKQKIKNSSCFIRDYSKTNPMEDFATFGENYFFLFNKKYLYLKDSACIKNRKQIFKNILQLIK